MEFENKTMFVSSANRGIGKSIVKVLLKQLFMHSTIILAMVFYVQVAFADNAAVGVNIYELGTTQASQDGWIQRLVENGVKTIRTSLSDKTVYFITQAYRHGIGSIVIIHPTWGSKTKHKLRWSDSPLSEADPQGLAAWFKPLLEQLEVAEVRLSALEFGNEINTSGYNSDIPMPGTGRVLGLADLNNPNDSEGPAIANGYRNYLRVLEALKDVRDHSKLNKTTPILSGASGDWGLPSHQSWNKMAESVSRIQSSFCVKTAWTSLWTAMRCMFTPVAIRIDPSHSASTLSKSMYLAGVNEILSRAG